MDFLTADSPPIDSPATGGRSHRRWQSAVSAVLLVTIMGLAAAVRIIGINRHGLVLDEIWTIEVATGRGSAHQTLPLNRLIQAPDFFDLASAPPWWRIWTHLDLTQPPLYWILLRWWEDAFGDSDFAGRMLSVVTSVLAVGLFFDAVRQHNGLTTAAWAATLMALASPQIMYGRITRNYALLLLLAIAMADAIIRIEHLGFSWRRWWGLLLATLATLLTHYFCVGVIAGLIVYSVLRFKGPDRRRIVGAMLIAGIVFAAVWGPFMWKQRHLFSTSDQAVDFLTHDVPDHVRSTIGRVLSAPAVMLFPTRRPMRLAAMCSAVLYVLPLILLRRRPDLLLWGIWLIGSVAVLAALDLTRGTTHLFYPRYFILAGPAVYVLLPGLFSAMKRLGWLRFAVPLAAAVACAAAAPDLLHPGAADPSEVVGGLANQVGSKDLLIFVSTPGKKFSSPAQYLLVDRCLGPLRCRMVLLTAPADAKVRACIRQSSHITVFLDEANWRDVLPGAHPFDGRMFPGRGLRMQLKPYLSGG